MNNNSLHEIILIPLLPENEKDPLFFPQLPLPSIHHSNIITSPPSTLLSPIPLRKYAKSMGTELNLGSQEIKNFKELYIRNHLAQMGLDLQICTTILSTIDYEKVGLDQTIEQIVDRYYAEEMKQQDLVLSFERKLSIVSFGNSFWNNEIIEPILLTEANSKTCQICYVQKHNSAFSTIPISRHTFCQSCITNYLHQSIHSNRILHIKCPDDCPYELTQQDIEILLKDDPELFKKYIKFRRILELSSKPNVRCCVRPGCDNYMEGNPNEKKLLCEKCGQEVCFDCKNEWHEGKSCEQAMDQEFKKYVERVIVKECPNCHNGIEKIEGCNHMTCGKCRFEFCWICGGKYSNNHYATFNFFGCPGLQYAHQDRKSKCRIYLGRFLWMICVLLMVSLAILAAPVAAGGTALFGPFVWFTNQFHPRCDFRGVLISFLILILSIVLSPVTLALMIFPGSCIFIYEKCK